MNKLLPNFILLIIFSLTVTNIGYSQISSERIDTLVYESMKKFDVIGVSVGIVKDGVIIHNKGYGLKSIKTKDNVNEYTNFAIASNSKAFTTVALSILVDQGKLSWNDKVKDLIPEFKMYNDYVTENFNITDLVTHRSGLGLGAGDLLLLPDGNNFTIKDILTAFQYFEPKSDFRTVFAYDNLLYLVAGEVIARISGTSWEEFVRTRIMEPLNMDNSFSSLKQITDKINLATPHSTDSGTLIELAHFEFDPEKINGAAGGIFSNVNDLCKWMLALLNEGKYGDNLDKQLFSEANHKEMWRIHTPFSVSQNARYNSHFAGYGLGWDLKDAKGKMVISHPGGVPGMSSKIILIPDLNLGVVILTNTSNGGLGVLSVSNTIIDSYLGLDDFGWIDIYYKYFQNSTIKVDSVVNQVWDMVKSVDNDHIKEENYLGVYEDKWFGKIEVYLNEKRLWFKSYRSPKLNGLMEYYKTNTFAIKWEYQDINGDAFAIYTLDEKGKAQTIRMKGISPNIDFSYDFQDLYFRRVKNKNLD